MLRAGIVGCGKIAGGYDPHIPDKYSATHAGAYHLCPGTHLVAVSDPFAPAREGFKKKWGVENIYPDYVQMLEKENLDVLSICLPTEFHFAVARAAHEAGIKAIFLEKPVSNDLDEAKQIRDMFKHDLVSVNYFRRWNPTLKAVSKALHSCKYGRPVSAVVRYTKGILVNGSHLVDLARWFWGEPVDAQFIRVARQDSQDPGIDFSLTFENGFTVYYVNVPDVDYVFIDMDIALEKGRVVIGQRGQALSIYDIKEDPHFQLFNILGEVKETSTEWQNCTTRAVNELVDCLQNGGLTSCTLDDGCKAVAICHEILKKA